MKKTKAMRLLDKERIEYKVHDYSTSGCISALDVAAYLGEDPKRLFKTLVTQGKSGTYYTVLVPGNRELDLKRTASLLGEKSLSMVNSKELLGLTGYVHGGVSPLGMKKTFKTLIDASCKDLKTIFISAGEIGWQLEVGVEDVVRSLSIIPIDSL